MVNKQVMGGERAGKAWGREEPSPAHPRTGSWRALYRKDAQETVFRGLSGATLPTENIYMHSPHWGWVH